MLSVNRIEYIFTEEWKDTTFFITCLCLERSERNDKKYV